MHPSALLIFHSMRPKQWVKNVFVLAPLLFHRGSASPSTYAQIIWATLTFCILCSSLYILNDVHDRDQDRHHAKKRTRPIASGSLKPETAVASAIILLLIALVSGSLLGIYFLMIEGLYFGITLTYILWIKRIPILDAVIIASGFILRISAGSAASGLSLPPAWILLSSFFLLLFLAFGKRRSELLAHTPMTTYSGSSLSFFIPLSGIAAFGFYVMYVFSRMPDSNFETLKLAFTALLVFLGIGRYSFLLYRKGLGDCPTEVLYDDRPLLFLVLLWLLALKPVLTTI